LIDVKPARRLAIVDQQAAVYILQGVLDRLHSPSPMHGR
jgi:hypothetical protein